MAIVVAFTMLLASAMLQSCSFTHKLHDSESERLPELVAVLLDGGKVVVGRRPANGLATRHGYSVEGFDENKFLDGLCAYEGIAIMVADACSDPFKAKRLLAQMIMKYPVFAARYKRVDTGLLAEKGETIESATASGSLTGFFSGDITPHPSARIHGVFPDEHLLGQAVTIDVAVFGPNEIRVHIVNPRKGWSSIATISMSEIESILSLVAIEECAYAIIISADAFHTETARAVMAQLSTAPAIIASYMIEGNPRVMEANSLEERRDQLAPRLPYGIKYFPWGY